MNTCWHNLPSSIYYKAHFTRQLNCWSLRCSWSIACRRCFDYMSILHLTLDFNILCKDNCTPRRLILEILRYVRNWCRLHILTVLLHYISTAIHWSISWEQGSLRQHGAHLGPTGPRWTPCWPHELCYLGLVSSRSPSLCGHGGSRCSKRVSWQETWNK